MSPVRNQPSRKAAARLVRPLPVLEKDRRAAHLELARRAFGHVADRRSSTRRTSTPGSGLPDEARPPLAVERIRQRHADLGHAVALEQRVAGDLAPALERLHRQRGRTRHHQPQPARALGPRALHVGGRRVPRRDQPVVDRRHRGEDGDLARREPVPDDLGVERRQDLARRAHRERRAQAR